MASEFLYITGSSISEVQSLIAPYIALGYNVVGSITEVLGMYTQGIEKIENDPGTVDDYIGVLASYNYSDGINRGNNPDMLSNSYRRRFGIVGNTFTPILSTIELYRYNGVVSVSPPLFNDMNLYFDANVANFTLNGSNVTEWLVSNDNYSKVSQASSSRQPTFIDNAVLFDGTDDYLYNTAFNTTVKSVLIKFKPSAIDADYDVIKFNDSQSLSISASNTIVPIFRYGSSDYISATYTGFSTSSYTTVVLTDPAGLNISELQLGYSTTYFSGSLEKVIGYPEVLTVENYEDVISFTENESITLITNGGGEYLTDGNGQILIF